MGFSVTSVLNTIVAATTRSPHAVTLSPDQDRYAHRARVKQDGLSLMVPPQAPPQSAQSGKSSEALEHDTLSRIRDALYRDQQA